MEENGEKHVLEMDEMSNPSISKTKTSFSEKNNLGWNFIWLHKCPPIQIPPALVCQEQKCSRTVFPLEVNH